MIAVPPQPQIESPVDFEARLLERERALIGALDWPTRMIAMVCDSRLERDMRLGACHKEPETIEWMERVIRPEETVFYDVGACSGAYSLVASALRAQVYAFEPSAHNFRQLERNASLNRLAINTFPVALGAERKLTGLRLSSPLPGAASHELMDRSFAEGEDGHVVMLYPLEEFRLIFELPMPQAIKVDTDGNELDVLRGAPMIMAQLRHLMIEVRPETAGQIDELCASAGLRRLRATRRIEPSHFNIEYARS